MARLPYPLDTLSVDAKRIYEHIAAKRGAVRGPFAPLMHHPALAEKVADVGEYLRFGSTLPGDIRELALRKIEQRDCPTDEGQRRQRHHVE